MDLEDTIQKIMDHSKLTRGQIKEKIDEQIKELSGLIDEEGAIVIVAKNLGVDLKENQDAAKLDADQSIGSLAPNKNASIVGRLVNIGDVRTFNKKDGSEGTLLPFVLEDNTGMIRCIAWGQFNTQIANEHGFNKGEILRIVNGFVKMGNTNALEIHIGSKSRMQLQPDNVDAKMIPKRAKGEVKFTKLKDISLSAPFVNIECLVSAVFPPKPFNRKDGSQGKRASISVRDEMESLYITFWGDHADKIKDLQQGQVAQITYLTPKPNYRDKTKIDLTATSNTQISIVESADSTQTLQIEKVEGKIRKINDMVENGGFGAIEGKLQEIEEIRKISTKDGRELDLMKIIVGDETGAIRINLWGDKVDPDLQVNATYRFTDVSVKLNSFSNQNEGTLSRSGQIEPLDKKIESNHTIEIKSRSLPTKEANIEEINQAENYSVKGTLIKDINRITTYRACSNCNRKIENCQCETPGEPANRMILNILLDDETGILRATLMGKRAENFLNTPTDKIVELKEAGELEQYLKMKNLELVGGEFHIKGKTRYSDFSNSYEMNISYFEELDPKEEIRQLFSELEN